MVIYVLKSKDIFYYSGCTLSECNFYVFHQANNFINKYLIKKLKLDTSKIPSTVEKYGNTSSVSVPLTIVDQLKDKMDGDKTVMLSAFGVGMTWATAIIPFHNVKISSIVEV